MAENGALTRSQIDEQLSGYEDQCQYLKRRRDDAERRGKTVTPYVLMALADCEAFIDHLRQLRDQAPEVAA